MSSHRLLQGIGYYANAVLTAILVALLVR